MKNQLASCFGAAFTLALATPSAFAALTLTNGNFETGGGPTVDDVSSWFDPSNGTYWQGSWVTDITTISPNNTNVVVLGSYESGQPRSQHPPTLVSAITSIRPLEPRILETRLWRWTSILVSRTMPPTADNSESRWQSMPTMAPALLRQETMPIFSQLPKPSAAVCRCWTTKVSNSGPPQQRIRRWFAKQATLDITGAGSQTLYLSFNNYRPAATDSWSVLDNVTITAIPEPSAALIGGLGLLALLRRRRH